jgi:hypothetical protein
MVSYVLEFVWFHVFQVRVNASRTRTNLSTIHAALGEWEEREVFG